MAFLPRTLEAISNRIRGDMRRELPGTDAAVWPNSLAVLAKVFAAAVHEAELRLAWIYRQLFTSTADGAHLERHAYEFGLARKAASRASGYLDFTSTISNMVYPAGISFLSDGARFISRAEAKSDGGGAISFFVSADLAGSAGNRLAGETFDLADPALYPTLSAQGAVAADGLGGGADIESDDSLRARVLDRKRRPPQGGAESDYEQFALAVSGVTHAWAYHFANGPGTIGVWFLFAGRANGIPTAADVAAVQGELDARRLIRAEIAVSAPIATPVDITVTDLADDTENTRAAIEASLAAMFANRARPGVAANPFRFSRSWIAEAISAAVGEDSHVLTLPAADIIYSAGEIPVMGTVTYV